MPYTVLARKYRSQTFDDVVGQDPIAQTLKNAIKSDRVAHAYLFTGTRGVGKTTMARILAKALNCLSSDRPTTEPCCKCDACTAINIGEDIDVIEIDGASNNGVEEVRRLRENAIYRPARCRFKIYIIDEVHMLTVQAFNALLKTLEEPPSHVKFIFATTEPNKVIATIQSRCQRFDFRNIAPLLIAAQLKFILEKEKIKYDDNLILPLAGMAAGSMRDGLSLLDRLISTGIEPLSAKLLEEYLGCPNSEMVYNLVEKIGHSDAAATLVATDDLAGSGLSEIQIADALVDSFRDLLVVKTASADSGLLILSDAQKQTANELAEKFDIAALVYNITTLEKLRFSLKNSETARPLLEAALLRLALTEHFLNVDDLLNQSGTSPHPPLKKNKPQQNLNTEPARFTPATPAPRHLERSDAQRREVEGSDSPPITPYLTDLKSVKANWQTILKHIAKKLGNGTAAIIASARPTRLENSILTLTFPTSCEMQLKMCQSNGRLEKIESLLAKSSEKPVKITLELADIDDPNRPKTQSQRQNELINDPAVKTVVTGLDATITGIEEN